MLISAEWITAAFSSKSGLWWADIFVFRSFWKYFFLKSEASTSSNHLRLCLHWKKSASISHEIHANTANEDPQSFVEESGSLVFKYYLSPGARFLTCMPAMVCVVSSFIFHWFKTWAISVQHVLLFTLAKFLKTFFPYWVVDMLWCHSSMCLHRCTGHCADKNRLILLGSNVWVCVWSCTRVDKISWESLHLILITGFCVNCKVSRIHLIRFDTDIDPAEHSQ